MKNILLTLLVCFSVSINAEGMDDSINQEIEHLFTYLLNSGCEFNRNGTWYTATEAASHIRKKYDYLSKKGMVKSTQFFIEKVASESSISGKPYHVKCQDKEVVTSAFWFNAELKHYRKSKRNMKFTAELNAR